jgi:hypothetical protein
VTARPLLAAAALAVAAGCAPTTLYGWGGYDEALYRHYRHPQEREAWVEELRTVVLEAEQEGRRVPPGVQAELGYALLEEGRNQDAIAWFRREQAQWPESRELMAKLIRLAEQRPGAPPGTVGPAGATEGIP